MELLQDMNDYILQPDPFSSTKQRGERGHPEYGWSKTTEELIVQLYFQLVREKNPEKLNQLEKIQRQILNQLISQLEVGEITVHRFKELFTLNYKLIAHTRDIYCGKGEQKISFLLILVWYDYSPNLAKKMLRNFLKPNDFRIKPFGSWKDMKYFCDYCISNGYSKEHPLIQYVFEMTVEQVKEDISLLQTEDEDVKISLLSKWIPREKTKFGWIFHELSFLYFKHYLETPKEYEKMERAILKCNTDFRKLITYMNKKLNTVQVKQSAKEWKNIDFNKLTSKTIIEQSRALFNLDEHGNQRTIYNDRIECANRFKDFIKVNLDSDFFKKKINCLPGDYVEKALHLLKRSTNAKEYEIDLLNTMWKNYVSQFSFFGNSNEKDSQFLIPIVDVSTNISHELLCHVIGLACFISEKSEKRIITFSGYTNWYNLENCETFLDKIKKMNETLFTEQVHMNSNFRKLIEEITQTMIENKSDEELLQNMSLVILSDMQVDSSDSIGTIYDVIEENFNSTGKCIKMKSFKPPHIIFWNVKSTNGFPTLPMQYNVSMLSGYNPNILKNFFKKKTNEPNDTCNSWFLLKKQLNQKRYEFLDDEIREELFCV